MFNLKLKLLSMRAVPNISNLCTQLFIFIIPSKTLTTHYSKKGYRFYPKESSKVWYVYSILTLINDLGYVYTL